MRQAQAIQNRHLLISRPAEKTGNLPPVTHGVLPILFLYSKKGCYRRPLLRASTELASSAMQHIKQLTEQTFKPQVNQWLGVAPTCGCNGF